MDDGALGFVVGVLAVIIGLAGIVTPGDYNRYGLLLTGNFADRPAYGILDRWYYANDTEELFYDNSTAWIEIPLGGGDHTKYAEDEEPSWQRRYFIPRGELTKVQANPVFTVGAAGKFDDEGVDNPCVLLIDGTYKMWYSGFDGAGHRIGLAHSTDRVTWTRQNSGNCVLDWGAGGAWDNANVQMPSVIYNGTTYHMIYRGHNGVTSQFGYATSPDGITWTRQNGGNAVLGLGAGGTWDDVSIMNPVISQLGKEWWMCYIGYDGANFNIGVAFCKSGDGITWQKYSGNPVVTKGAGGAWDDFRVFFIGFYWDQGVFYILYAGIGGPNDYQLGTAFSPNGQVFTKYDANPIFAASGNPADWDHWKESPSMLRVGEVFYVWYSGAEQATDANEIGLATIS